MAVLIVEDEPLVRWMLVDAFREAGFDVVETETGEEALALLDKPTKICGLLTDIELGDGMSGIKLAHEVRNRHDDLPIMICSGRVVPGPKELPSNARFFNKPLLAGDLAQIANVLRNCLS